MNDTTPNMRKKQFEIYQSKSIDEKIKMVAEMMEFGINQTKSVIKGWHPDKSEIELQIEFFKLYYREDFKPEAMNLLVNKMREKAA